MAMNSGSQALLSYPSSEGLISIALVIMLFQYIVWSKILVWPKVNIVPGHECSTMADLVCCFDWMHLSCSKHRCFIVRMVWLVYLRQQCQGIWCNPLAFKQILSFTDISKFLSFICGLKTLCILCILPIYSEWQEGHGSNRCLLSFSSIPLSLGLLDLNICPLV